MQLAQQIGKNNRPAGQTVAQFVRQQFDALPPLAQSFPESPGVLRRSPCLLPSFSFAGKSNDDVPQTRNRLNSHSETMKRFFGLIASPFTVLPFM